MSHLRLRVPATSANLGPGFDSLGLALSLYNDFLVSASERILVEGCEPGHEGPDNLFVAAYRRGLEEMGSPFIPIRVRFEAAVPIARGLGSSSTCIVGGLLAAGAVAAGAFSDPCIPLCSDAASRARLLDLAAEIEGHPDNVAPAFLGGFVAAAVEGGHVVAVRALVGPELVFNALVPPFPLETSRARAALPAFVTHKDAAYNAGRAALVAAAFVSRDYEALGAACLDRLHEPHRAPLIPGFSQVVAAAREAGALAVFLSGAGPTVMAICREDGGRFAGAIATALAERGCAEWRLLELRADESGASAALEG